MIAVIADDFTGAAEICGIGLRHGLNVILETEAIKHQNVDLLVVATDTRSMSAADAEVVVAKITSQLIALKPRFIFKKLDSVLRGNVYVELQAQMKASGLAKCLVVAGNPVFGRFIKDGVYYINDVPLDQTGFASDPDFPISSSSVAEIIGNGNTKLSVALKPGTLEMGNGILMGDVTGFGDLERWAKAIDSDCLPAGASGFFNALCSVQSNLNRNEKPTIEPFGAKLLYVLGSSYPKDGLFITKLSEDGLYVSNMPESLYHAATIDATLVGLWAEDIVFGLTTYQRVVILATHASSNATSMANRVKQIMGEVTKAVLSQIEVDELLVEGGSTVSAVLNCLCVKKLFPFQEYATGIIRMKVDGYDRLCLTTKPGSYKWPDEVLGITQPVEVK